MDANQQVNAKYALFVLLVLAAAVAVWYFVKPVRKITPVAQETPTITVDNTKAMLDKQSSIKPGKTSSSTPIALADLPEPYAFLVLPKAQNLNLQKNTYANGDTGFTVRYTVESDIQAAHFALLQSGTVANWQVKTSSRALLATRIELEKNKQKIQITCTKEADNSISVYAQSIQTND